jgi:uncharacterized damage-inducible protein DinB
MLALSTAELLAWLEHTSAGWRALLSEHPEALDFPCDVREGETVRDLVHHIVAVELRYVERLLGLPASAYEALPRTDAAALYATHDRAMAQLRELLARADEPWEEELEFVTRSAGTLRASRRVVLVHLMMHSIRHYAQLATLVRQRGVTPGWGMDYLLMGAR